MINDYNNAIELSDALGYVVTAQDYRDIVAKNGIQWVENKIAEHKARIQTKPPTPLRKSDKIFPEPPKPKINDIIDLEKAKADVEETAFLINQLMVIHEKLEKIHNIKIEIKFPQV